MSRPHPLDPITAGELVLAVGVARTAPELSTRVKVVSVEAREPAKDDYWLEGACPGARYLDTSCADIQYRCTRFPHDLPREGVS